MSIIPLRWACFPFKSSRIAQRVHLFSMDFDDSLTIYLTFYSMVKVSLSGNTIYLRLLSIKGCDAIRLGLNCFISMIISVA